MADPRYISFILQDLVYVLILIFGLIYSSFILFIPRFRHGNNIFILNICFSISIDSVYYVVFFTMSYVDLQDLYGLSTCSLVFYIYSFASVSIPFSFLTFTIHRFCTIVYQDKPFFKTKQWVIICIASERIAELLLAIPFIFKKQATCGNPVWLKIYTFVVAVCVPLIINTVFNGLIFNYARSSTRRVHAHNTDTNTNINNNQHAKLSRRDISLLKHMVFMFLTFMLGWIPVYLIIIVDGVIKTSPLIFPYASVLGGLAILAITINFFICNHEVNEYLMNQARRCIRR